MIKGARSSGAVVFALEPGNILRLMRGDPIVIDMAEVYHPEAGLLVISYLGPDKRHAMPADPETRAKVERVILLNATAINVMYTLPVGGFISQDMDGIEVQLMIGDRSEIEQEMRKDWTPTTVVTHRGRSPSDTPPSNN